MYSYPRVHASPSPLHLFLIDIETGEVFEVERGLEYSREGHPYVKHMTNNLVNKYIAGLSGLQTEQDEAKTQASKKPRRKGYYIKN